MINSVFRPAQIICLCFVLSGCVTGITLTNLKVVSDKEDDKKLLKPINYIVHDTGEYNRITERKSWVDALSGFTSKDNIFFENDGKLIGAGNVNSLSDIAKQHPIVNIYLSTFPEDHGWTFENVSLFVSFFTFGLLPGYYSEPLSASFKLTLPNEMQSVSASWEYSYERQSYLWLPLIIFVPDFVYSINGGGELSTNWKIREKRRLILIFLNDAKQKLKLEGTND